MAYQGITFAALAAISFGMWTVFHQQASKGVSPLLGAIIVSFTAVALGAVILALKASSESFNFTPKGMLFAILAGIFALGLDFFILKAYGSGLDITIAGPIVIGGSIAIATIIGFLLGESITVAKLIGIISVVAGSGILAAYGT